jgi:hypothetical protein
MTGKKKEASNRDQPNLAGMPEAVRITLWFDSDPQAKLSATSNEHTNAPMVFQTVARLMLADTTEPGAASSSSDDTSSQGSATQGMPAQIEN